MSTANETTGGKHFLYKWHIQNFDFCWHKTGEYLSSPLFVVPSLENATWKLRLYPRGEDNGEFVGCFLWRGKKGGPESVRVDFELSLSVARSQIANDLSFLGIYSFKKSLVEGRKCFARRWEVFAPKAAQKEKFTLTLTCKFLNLKADDLGRTEEFGCTRINVERISGFEELCGDDSDYNVQVQPLLEDEPLISINIRQFEESLVVKMIPQTCEQIRYAICKIAVLKTWPNEPPIEYACHWIGGIEDTWRHHDPIPEIDSTEKPITTPFFLSYDFSFSTGYWAPLQGIEDFGAHMLQKDVSLQECSNVNADKSAPTALEAMASTWPSYDIRFWRKTEISEHSFPAHKAVLCARSSRFKSFTTKDVRNLNVDFKMENFKLTFGKFVQFFYTDKVTDMSWTLAHDLYSIADIHNVDLLKSMCATYLADNLDPHNAACTLNVAHNYKDVFLKRVLS